MNHLWLGCRNQYKRMGLTGQAHNWIPRTARVSARWGNLWLGLCGQENARTVKNPLGPGGTGEAEAQNVHGYPWFEEQAVLVSSGANRMERSALSKLKCRVLPLHIETGRYSGRPLGERLCLVCEEGLLEDETHFRLVCPTLHQTRTEFLTEISSLHPEFCQLNNKD